jgi:uncharacterized membrane protein
MDSLFNTLLIVHIISGASGLITGSLNMARKKGDQNHRRMGKVFSYSMLTAGFSALALASLHPNTFLFIVGIFTIYLVGSGHRYIYLRLLGQAQKPTLIDWALSTGMFLFGVGFLGMGISLFFNGNNMGIVLLVFGMVGLRFVLADTRNYLGRPREKNYWLMAHLQRMSGGYIAATTAFLVVNMKYFPAFIPPAVYWLLPTLVVTPLIIRWSRQFRAT